MLVDFGVCLETIFVSISAKCRLLKIRVIIRWQAIKLFLLLFVFLICFLRTLTVAVVILDVDLFFVFVLPFFFFIFFFLFCFSLFLLRCTLYITWSRFFFLAKEMKRKTKKNNQTFVGKDHGSKKKG